MECAAHLLVLSTANPSSSQRNRHSMCSVPSFSICLILPASPVAVRLEGGLPDLLGGAASGQQAQPAGRQLRSRLRPRLSVPLNRHRQTKLQVLPHGPSSARLKRGPRAWACGRAALSPAVLAGSCCHPRLAMVVVAEPRAMVRGVVHRCRSAGKGGGLRRGHGIRCLCRAAISRLCHVRRLQCRQSCS